MSTRTRIRAGLVIAMTLGALFASSAPAGASEKTIFPLTGFSPFGSFSEGSPTEGFPTAVAVDPGTEEVFISDGSPANSVEIFGPEGGSPLGSLTGTGSELFSFAHEVAGVAVDNDPTSPSFHDLYVSDVIHGVVDKFRRVGLAAYEYVCQFNGWYGPGEEACHVSGGTPEEAFSEPLGVTVDAQGDVYIASYGPGEGAIDEFNDTGKGVVRVKSTEHALLNGHPKYVDVDSTGDIFVLNYTNGEVVAEFKRSSLTGGVESENEIGSGVVAIAADPNNNDLYLDHGNNIVRYVASGAGELKREGEFGRPILGDSRGLAIDDANHTIYASDAGNLDADAFEEKTVSVPDFNGGCKASVVKITSATLTGEVDPHEAAGASYKFEYGIANPEEFQTGGPVEGEGFKPVAAEVGGLEPGTLYRCRISATDAEAQAGGAGNQSIESFFETLPLPPVIEEPPASASEVTTESAIFNGSVNPGNGATTCYFAYGLETGQYPQKLPGVGIGGGSAVIPVEQSTPPAALQPGTLYHFALVCANASGTTVGPDEIFTTVSAGNRPSTSPIANTGSAASVSQNGAVLTGVVVPEGLPTLYEFEVGTTTSYGTVIFGGEAGGGLEETAVAQAVGSLQPGVTYHYRLVAFNGAGVTAGSDGTFTTAALPAGIAQPATLPILATPVFPVVKYPKEKVVRPKHHKTKKKHSKSKHRAKAKKSKRK
jgi:hypothetical protein